MQDKNNYNVHVETLAKSAGWGGEGLRDTPVNTTCTLLSSNSEQVYQTSDSNFMQCWCNIIPLSQLLFQSSCLRSGGLGVLVHHQLVVHTKLTLRHTTQKALHDDTTGHMCRQNLTWRIKEKRDRERGGAEREESDVSTCNKSTGVCTREVKWSEPTIML